MSSIYSVRTINEDRDLSRAAAERHFIRQALSESQRSTSTRSGLGRIIDRLFRA